MSEPAADDADTPKPKKLGSTALRFATAIPLVVVVALLLFYLPKWGFQVFGMLWIAICARELMRMTLPESPVARAWGLVATTGLGAVLLFAKHPAALPTAVLGLAIGALVAALARPLPIESASRRLGWLLGGPIYVAGTLACLAQLHAHTDGGAWVLLSMFLAFLSDTGAYFAGRAFGKHKLSPALSPKKTIEGSVGGLVAAALGAVALQQTLLAGRFPLIDAVLLAFVGAALGQAGDLLESMIKRSCGVKDSGNIMPGHGGLLDRSDALMFTGAATWLYVTWLLPIRG